MSIVMLSGGSSSSAMLDYLGRGGAEGGERAVAWDASTVADRLEDVDDVWAMTRDAFGTHGGREYGHAAFSVCPEDPRAKEISNDELLEIGRELAEHVAPGHDWVAVVHRDREHPHVHVVWNSVSHDTGKKFHCDAAKRREAIAIKHAVDRRHGLELTPERRGRDRVPKRVHMMERRNPASVPIVTTVKERVADARDHARSYEDFRTRLRRRGVGIEEYVRDDVRHHRYLVQTEKGRVFRVGEGRLGADYEREHIERAIEERTRAARSHDEPEPERIDVEQRRRALGREIVTALDGEHARWERSEGSPREAVSRNLIERTAVVPILEPATLDRLQEQAFERRDAAVWDALEGVRVSTAAERGEPTRVGEQLGRLAAQTAVARAEVGDDRAADGPDRPREPNPATELAEAVEVAFEREASAFRGNEWAIPEPRFRPVEVHTLETRALERGDRAMAELAWRAVVGAPAEERDDVLARSEGLALVAALRAEILDIRPEPRRREVATDRVRSEAAAAREFALATRERADALARLAGEDAARVVKPVVYRDEVDRLTALAHSHLPALEGGRSHELGGLSGAVVRDARPARADRRAERQIALPVPKAERTHSPQAEGRESPEKAALAHMRALGGDVDIVVVEPRGECRVMPCDIQTFKRIWPSLDRENAGGANILVRPSGDTGTILLRDMTAAESAELEARGYYARVAVAIEPGRQDIWIKLTRDPLTERERNLAAQSLGDKDRTEGQFERQGVGWLAGFVNHRAPARDGDRPPRVAIERTADRVAERGDQMVREVRSSFEIFDRARADRPYAVRCAEAQNREREHHPPVRVARPAEPPRPEPARQPKVEHTHQHSFTRGR
jgi:hypothetical protein